MRFLTLLLVLAITACGQDVTKASVNIGDKAPEFTTLQANGSSVSFPVDHSEKVLVIRFWADWCKYCEGEMRAIESVYQRHKNRGLIILAINAGQDKATVDAFIKKIGASYPALMDEKSDIAKRYGVVGLPTTFFIDNRGVIRAKIVGEADEKTFERQVQELLQ